MYTYNNHFSFPPGVHWDQFPEHRFLLSERSERPAPEPSDRHLRLKLRKRPNDTQNCSPGQDFL